MADQVKISNLTNSRVSLARTGKKEYFINPKGSLVILTNEIEEDPRLKSSVKRAISSGIIDTSIISVSFDFPRDDPNYSLDSTELDDYVETERESIFDLIGNILVCQDGSLIIDNCGNVVVACDKRV